MSAIRILVVDDHAIVRDGIRALLALAQDMAVVGEAGSGRDAITLAQTLSPDVILMDIAMPDLGGLEATVEIRKARPDARILILSQYADAGWSRADHYDWVSGGGGGPGGGDQGGPSGRPGARPRGRPRRRDR